MKISTERFKSAVSKSIKGAGNNNLIPITSMLGIKSDSGNIMLSTTDGTNNLVVIIDKVQVEEDFDITVQAEVFGKLIAKITSDSVDLQIKDNVLIVKANGTYKIPLVSDEDGLVVFPIIPTNIDDKALTVKLTTLQNIYNINRLSLATTFENPFLTGYWVGDMVISTDANVICLNDIDAIGTANGMLINPQMVSLLTLNTQEDIEMQTDGKNLVFKTSDVIVTGPQLAGVNDYPVDAVKGYLGEAFPSMCKVPKALLISALDRLALFIEPYDMNGAYFTFGRQGINIKSKKSSSVEVISYTESKDFKSFICCVDIPMLKTQLEAYPEDVVTLWYGLDNAIKLTSGKVTQVISLLEDEELNNSDNE